jgi:hypothetical protein
LARLTLLDAGWPLRTGIHGGWISLGVFDFCFQQQAGINMQMGMVISQFRVVQSKFLDDGPLNRVKFKKYSFEIFFKKGSRKLLTGRPVLRRKRGLIYDRRKSGRKVYGILCGFAPFSLPHRKDDRIGPG